MILRTMFLLLAVLLAALPSGAEEIETMVIVSVDALHPDGLGEMTTPAMYGLMQNGSYTLRGRSTDPPQTLIAHTALFTGLQPAKSGKTDNEWAPGQKRVQQPTIFDTAKKAGYRTAFFYSKTKLGYLVNDRVDEHGLAPDDGIERARKFLRNNKGKKFVFLHRSGLEYEGMEFGWMSPEYLAELRSIDRDLGPLLEYIRNRGRYLLIVTSDHAGHEKLHGTDHTDDYRLPLIVASDTVLCGSIQHKPFHVTELKALVEKTIESGSCAGK